MSSNREYSSWKAVLAQLRRTRSTWRGAQLSSHDHNKYVNTIVHCAMIMVDLSNRYDGIGSYRDLVRWCHFMATADVAAVAEALSEAVVLLRHIYMPNQMTLNEFKAHLAPIIPEPGMLVAPIKGSLQSFLNDPSPDLLYAPYQFFSYMLHLSLDDIDMSDELEAEYCNQEELNAAATPPSAIVPSLRAIMADWLKDFRVEEPFYPQHGPGAVAEYQSDSTIFRKYRVLRPDLELLEAFWYRAGINADSYCPFRADAVTSRQSQIIFVPKSMKTKRVISKEPATLQYFQQGVAQSLMSYMRSHPHLRRVIDLRDQSKQCELALTSSSTQQFATVDLSAASDSVTLKLVQAVFADTKLLPFLEATRSKTALLPSGKVVAMGKFAPMGSALCFPIQTLIFACICEYTVRYVYATTGEHHPMYGVYGDDIIIADRCLDDLVVYLGLCGFRINHSKSYGSPYRFRESCGMEAYDGRDVTPMKVGRKFTANQVISRSANRLSEYIDTANTAGAYGYRLLRRHVIEMITSSGYMPLFSSDSRGIFSPCPTNFRAPHAWDPNIQEDMVAVDRIETCTALQGHIRWSKKKRKYVPLPERSKDERIRLFEWLRLTRKREANPFDSNFVDCLDEEFVQRPKIGSAGTYIARQWEVDPTDGKVVGQSFGSPPLRK